MKRYLPATLFLLSLALPALAQPSNEDNEENNVPGTGPLPVRTEWFISSMQLPLMGTGAETDLSRYLASYDYPGPILNFAIETGSGEGMRSDNVRVQLYFADPFPEELEEPESEEAFFPNIDFYAPNAVTSLVDAVEKGHYNDTIFHGITDQGDFQFLFGGLWKRSQDPLLDLERLMLVSSNDTRDRSILPQRNDFLYIPASAELIGTFQFHLGDSKDYAFNFGQLAGRIIGHEESSPAILTEIFEWQKFSLGSIGSFSVPLKDYTPEDLDNFKRIAWENYARVAEVTVENQTGHPLEFKLLNSGVWNSATGEITPKAGVTAALTPEGLLTLTVDLEDPELGTRSVYDYFVEYQVDLSYIDNETPQTRRHRSTISFDLLADLAILTRFASPVPQNPGYWTTQLFGRIYSHYEAPPAPSDGETENAELQDGTPLVASQGDESDGVWQPGEWFWSDVHGYLYPAVTKEELHSRSDLDGDGLAETWDIDQNGFWLYNQSPAEEGDLGWIWTSPALWKTFYSHTHGEWLHYMHSALVPPNEAEGEMTWKDERVFWSWEYKDPDGPFWGEYVTPELVDNVVQLIKFEPPPTDQDGD